MNEARMTLADLQKRIDARRKASGVPPPELKHHVPARAPDNVIEANIPVSSKLGTGIPWPNTPPAPGKIVPFKVLKETREKLKRPSNDS